VVIEGAAGQSRELAAMHAVLDYSPHAGGNLTSIDFYESTSRGPS
jgi:hypothetical protein